ncbi:hypothetical protein GCM10010272_66220 [Streptomyces lateritius]|nr:hypothetical protein GCM10010272_66220 [Streptomyces lateritius]
MDGRGPRPEGAEDAGQFVALMRQLRIWANLSFRELERRAESAGDVLPRATLAGALNRSDLPREELLAAFVRACGGERSEVDAWVAVRKRLAVVAEQRSSADASAGPAAAGSLAAPLPSDGSDPHSPTRPAAQDDSFEEARDPGDADADADAGVSAGPGTSAGVPGASRVDSLAPGAVYAAAASKTNTGVAAEDPAVQEESSTTGPRAHTAAAGPESAAARRSGSAGLPGRALVAGVVAALLSAGVTGIVLAPDDHPGEPPAQQTRPPATATLSPPATQSRTPHSPAVSSPVTEPGATNVPVPGATRRPPRSAPPSKSTARPGEPGPRPTSRAPESIPHEPPPPYEPPPYEPPPSFPASSPPPEGGGGDPFPEETCWDANDCA